MHKPPSQWTVIAAFILAVALHVGAVLWVEMKEEKPLITAAVPAVTAPKGEVVFEKAGDTGMAGLVGEMTAFD